MKFVSVPNPARILLLAAPLFGALALSTICLKPGPAGRPTSSAHPADRVVACAATAAGSIGIQPSITATAGAHDSARAMPRAVRFAAVDAILPDLPGAARDWRTFAPESLTVAVVPGCPLTFHRVSREDDSRSITWTGGNGLPGVALVGVGTSAGWDAILTVPGANDFEIHVRGLRASVCEIDPGLDHCGNETAPRLRADQAGRESIGGGTAGRAAAVTNAATVDVVFFFDGEAVQAAARRAPDGNGESLLVSTLQARTVLCNFALGQSGVTNFEWHDVGARRIPAYTRTGKMNDDLAELTSGGDEAGRFMAAQAAALCADQAVLVVGGGTDYAGLAWVP
jgi:hypothetical protein